VAEDIAGQMLGTEDRSSWCGDTDSTGRFVCQRIRDHALDWHAGRNDAGGIHQWKVAGADEGRENMPVAIPSTDSGNDPIGTVRIEQLDAGHSVWQHTGGTPGNEWMCVWSTAHGNEGCTLLPEDVAGFLIAGAVPGTPAAASTGDGAARLVDSLLTGLERRDAEIADHWRAAEVDESTKAELAKENITLRAEVAELRASREAWAIEADRLDVITTAAEYHTGPEECCDSECDHLHDDEGNFTGTDGEWCPHVEMRHATAEDAIEAHKVPLLEARIETLDREAAADAEAYQDLLGAIWLHVGWRSVTRRLTTRQRELWADAVEVAGDPGSTIAADRWWRDDATVVGADTKADGGEGA
jgi:hypothetical protein